MAKSKKIYSCRECGYQTSKWIGQCPSCGEWGSFDEELEIKGDLKSINREIRVKQFDEIEIETTHRYITNFQEFDRVLGGGLVKGGIVLLTGNPGVGKSTLLLQVLQEYTKYGKVLYVTGEESAEQVKLRGKRLGIESNLIYIMAETEVELIENYIGSNKPVVVIVDSIQTLYSTDHNSIPGTVTQVRESTLRIMNIAKSSNISFFIVGHITKGGQVAGPKLLEHMVDTVLSFEGEEDFMYRMIRSVKNRFGSTNEVAIFNMEEDGLTEIKNPSEFFLSQREEKNIGSVIVPALEGSKIFLLEVQALTNTTAFGMPKRVIQGFDYNRVQIIAAILEKKLNLNFSAQDIYLNVPGGITIRETSADLGVSLILVSNVLNKGIGRKTAAIGEIGLRGEIRKVSFVIKRLKELEKMGFQEVYVPLANKKEVEKAEIKINMIYLNTINELIERMG